MLHYRDPLFSVIVFLLLIALGFLVSNFFMIIKEKNKIKHLREFIDKFDFLNDKDIKDFFSQEDVSINTLLLLAIAFEKEGNYEKSLNIYLTILNNTTKDDRYDVLQNMADVYLKAGFLHKAKEALLEILRAKPRNIKALYSLIIVDDKLKDYSEMDNIIEILEELDINVEKEKAYLEFNKAFFYQNKAQIDNVYNKYPIIKRKYFQFLLNKNPKQLYDIVSKNDVYDMLDIFWKVDDLPLKNEAFIQIEAAKKKIKIEKKSEIFELEVLKYTPKDLADLEFEYICQNCKHLFPIYEDRCPHCKELFSLKIETNIIKKS